MRVAAPKKELRLQIIYRYRDASGSEWILEKCDVSFARNVTFTSGEVNREQINYRLNKRFTAGRFRMQRWPRLNAYRGSA